MKKEKKPPELKKKRWHAYDCAIYCLRSSPFWFSAMIFFRFVWGLFPAAQIFTTASFVDSALAIFAGKAGMNSIFLPLGGIMGIALFLNFSDAIYTFIIHKFRNSFVVRTNMVFTEMQASLKYRYIEDPETLDLIRRATEDPAGKMSDRATRLTYVVQLILSIATTVAAVFVAVWYSGIAAVLFLIPSVILAVRSGLDDYDAFWNNEKIMRRADSYGSMLFIKDYLEERRTFGYTPFILGRWLKSKKEADAINIKTSIRNARRQNLSNVLNYLVYAGVGVALLFGLSQGKTSAGMFVGTMNAILALSWRLYDAAWQIRWFVQCEKNLGDLSGFIALERDEETLAEPADMSGKSFGTIEFRNVTFRYPGTERDILKNCSFTLEEGVRYAVVGVNGAGKTTMTKLLTKLYDEYEGEITVGGRNLRDIPLSEVKGLFSVVFQDFAKYEIKYRDNIALGAPEREADDNAVLDATHRIGLDDALRALHSGLDTPLGKAMADGVDLSGGEWQRVAIARSLYKNAPMSILDEPTAALDPLAEKAVYEMFRDVTRGRSAIFITHRLGAARIADKILLIDGGAVSEFGSHDELMKLGGKYAEMFHAQSSWYEEGGESA